MIYQNLSMEILLTTSASPMSFPPSPYDSQKKKKKKLFSGKVTSCKSRIEKKNISIVSEQHDV